MTIDIQRAGQIDRESLFHPFTWISDLNRDGPTLMSEGRGVRLKDIHGKEYLDGMAGLWCVNLGYGRKDIVDALAQQSAKLSSFHAFNSMSTDVAAECAQEVLKHAPVPMARVFFGVSGSDANETQIKLIWYYNNLLGRPKKKKIIARQNAYHGSSIVTSGLTGLANMHTRFDLPLGPILHVSSPNYYKNAPAGMSERDFSKQLAAELDDTIKREGADTVAAFFAEPVMGAGGLVPPPEGYFEEIVPVLERHDVLLVLDEVVSGFGRLGTYWGSQTYNLQPDLISAAKGITSGYFPMSACLVSPKIWDVIEKHTDKAGLFAHGYTYSAHPVGAAVALATMKAIDEEGIVANAAAQGAHLQRVMREAIGAHPLVGNVRGAGMMIGIELVRDKATKEAFPAANRTGRRVLQAAAERGLITRALGDTLVFAPPLVATQADVSELIAIFKDSLDKVANEIL